MLSDADALARWYEVTVAGPRTLRLGLGGDAAVEVVLDSALRVAEVAVVAAGERNVELRVRLASSACRRWRS